jgi:hypothetical protein
MASLAYSLILDVLEAALTVASVNGFEDGETPPSSDLPTQRRCRSGEYSIIVRTDRPYQQTKRETG